MNGCPDCDRDFGTVHGLRVHQAAKHARLCPVCPARLLSDYETAIHLYAVHNGAEIRRVFRVLDGDTEEEEILRMHGWCEKCRRVKMVRVTGAYRGGAPIGVCSSCEQEEDERRKQVRR